MNSIQVHNYSRILDETDAEHANERGHKASKQGCRQCRVGGIQRMRDEEVSDQRKGECQRERCHGQQSEGSYEVTSQL